jgi:hypothetical protein
MCVEGGAWKELYKNISLSRNMLPNMSVKREEIIIKMQQNL